MELQPDADDYLEACEGMQRRQAARHSVDGECDKLGGTASRLIFDELFNAMTMRGLLSK